MKKIAVIFFLFFSRENLAAQHPIALHPQNPHYFLYKNKPTVLVTSGEHYGAVLNLDFDFETYLNALQKDGLNLTRVFTGAYVEPNGAFGIEQNTLAPVPLKFICPWARSNEAGYLNGGNKFNLERWDEAYFKRLKDFMSAARQRDIIVELTFFCPFYEDNQWRLSPMNDSNNVTHVATAIRLDNVYTISENTKKLNAVQAKMVRRIVTELNRYDNLLYELINEPYFGGVTKEWQHFIATVIDSTEKTLPNKHLLTQNIANGSAVITEPDKLVSVFNFHYASPPNAVAQNYHLNKVIGCNETGFKGTSDSVYRLQAWQFMLAGGALFNNLDYSFTSSHEDGTFAYNDKQPGGGSATLRKQLSVLKNFIESVDFVQMKPDSNFYLKKLNPSVEIKALVKEGEQYAFHISGGKSIELELPLAAGNYNVAWINTLTGDTIASREIISNGNQLVLTSPHFDPDIALKILRKK